MSHRKKKKPRTREELSVQYYNLYNSKSIELTPHYHRGNIASNELKQRFLESLIPIKISL